MTSVGYTARDYAGSPALFLDFVSSKLEWGDLAGDIVFDVGCGNPRTKLADLVVTRYPNVRHVIAIDNQLHLIRYIMCKKPNPLIDYRCADIQRRGDLTRFEGAVDKVLSTHCLHMVREQEAAFGNIFFMLKPGGEAAFFFCHSSGYADWYTDITQNADWNKYFNGKTPVIPVTQHMRSLTDDYYTKLLQDAGFEVVYCEKDTIRMSYTSEQTCREGLLKLSDSWFAGIPPELNDEFSSFLLDSFVKHNELDEQGKPCQISYYITAMVRKPIE